MESVFRWINEELKPYDIGVHKVAPTCEQVIKYKLPPIIPEKNSPRTPKFVKKFGEVADELDVLHLVILRDIIKRSILEYMDVYRCLEVEVAKGIKLEAYRVVYGVLRSIREEA